VLSLESLPYCRSRLQVRRIVCSHVRTSHSTFRIAFFEKKDIFHGVVLHAGALAMTLRMNFTTGTRYYLVECGVSSVEYRYPLNSMYRITVNCNCHTCFNSFFVPLEYMGRRTYIKHTTIFCDSSITNDNKHGRFW
jgi:hypothetical protein